MSHHLEVRYGAEQVDLDRLHELLRTTYWAAGRPRALIERAVRNSFCASAWAGATMIGFARLITDFATHAYLADVIIDPAWRRRGIATRLVRRLIDHEAVATCWQHLHTRDAHDVYAPLGYANRLSPDGRSMDLSRPPRWRPADPEASHVPP